MISIHHFFRQVKMSSVPFLQTSPPFLDSKWRPGFDVWAGTSLPEMENLWETWDSWKWSNNFPSLVSGWDLKSIIEIECFWQRKPLVFGILKSLCSSEAFLALNYAVNLDLERKSLTQITYLHSMINLAETRIKTPRT